MNFNNYENENVRSKLIMQLFVSGMSPRSLDAIANLKKICDDHLEGNYELEIIDIYKQPEIASQMQIVFSPSLIKTKPLPKRVLVGTFADTEKVIKALGIR